MENREIKDYIILKSYSSLDLRKDVLDKIKEGYIPCGGVSLSVDNNWNHNLAQAMIKYAVK
jgi:hypothetical protein